MNSRRSLEDFKRLLNLLTEDGEIVVVDDPESEELEITALDEGDEGPVEGYAEPVSQPPHEYVGGYEF